MEEKEELQEQTQAVEKKTTVKDNFFAYLKALPKRFFITAFSFLISVSITRFLVPLR